MKLNLKLKLNLKWTQSEETKLPPPPLPLRLSHYSVGKLLMDMVRGSLLPVTTLSLAPKTG